jgi:hypothetical protein
LGGTDSHGSIKESVSEVVQMYKPSDPDEDYVAEYEAAGHTPEVAKRLAVAYEAAEGAIEAGVLQEAGGNASKIVRRLRRCYRSR